jgi:lysine-specific demethylase/histidyl-hydroxylase NO66
VVPHLWRHTGSFDDVLSLADVDRLIAGAGLRRPAVRLVRDGAVIPPADYTRRARTGGTTISDLVDPGRVLDQVADGATVVLQGLHRWWPPAARFCRDIELVLGHAVQANAYLTPAGAAGLAPHHDTHDVFVLQVAGTKHWTVRRPYLDTPLPRHASDHEIAATQPVLFEAEMTSGDALYLPRGVVHSAAAQRGLSLHLTIGILATTVHDVLRELVDLAAEEVRFRRSLTPGWAFDPDGAEGEVKSAVAALVDWLATADAGAVAERLRDRFVANRTPLLEGQLLEIAALDEVGDDTQVVRRPGAVAHLRVEPPGGDTGAGDGGEVAPRLQLVLGDRRLTMPAALEPAVRRLLDGEPHRVGDLADLLDAPSRRVLVRRLVREGILCTRPAPSDA